jgi:hypothetical protein
MVVGLSMHIAALWAVNRPTKLSARMCLPASRSQITECRPDQDSPDVHTAPHAPQLLTSVLVSVHVPEQRSPLGVMHWHRPLLHTWPVGGKVSQPEHTDHWMSLRCGCKQAAHILHRHMFDKQAS